MVSTLLGVCALLAVGMAIVRLQETIERKNRKQMLLSREDKTIEEIFDSWPSHRRVSVAEFESACNTVSAILRVRPSKLRIADSLADLRCLPKWSIGLETDIDELAFYVGRKPLGRKAHLETIGDVLDVLLEPHS